MEQPERFPSPVGTDFVRIDWTDRNCPKENNWRDRLRLRISSISRRVWMIIIAILMLILLVIAILIVVLILFILPKSDDNANQNVVSSTRAPGQTTTSTPYPLGYIVGTDSKYWATEGNITSLFPDYRSYEYRQRLITYGNGSIFIIGNTSYSMPLQLDDHDCDTCTLLALSDECIETLNCTSSSAIHCCTGCPEAVQICNVHGILYENAGFPVERRISTDGEQLLTTSLTQQKCALQVERVNETGIIFTGPVQACPVPGLSPDLISTVSLNPDNTTTVDVVISLNVTSQLLYLNSLNHTVSVHLKDLKDPKQIISSVYGSHVLVAVLQADHFYSVRFHVNNGCLSNLAGGYQVFSYSGQLMGGYWLDDLLMLWYRERSGVNIVHFTFAWPNDDTCTY